MPAQDLFYYSKQLSESVKESICESIGIYVFLLERHMNLVTYTLSKTFILHKKASN